MALSIPIITEFDGKGIAKARQEFSQLEGAGAKAQYAIKKAAVPATAALAGLAAGLGASVKAAMEDAAAANLLAIALQKTTKATEKELAANADFIDSLMLATNTADDELRPAMARLSRSTKDVTKAQELLKLAVDISKGSGKSLETVVSALAKGYDGNTNALGKLGLGLDQSLIKSKDFGKITEELQRNFGGFGKAVGQTTEGQLAKFQLGMAELKESIGMALIPVLEKALPILNKMGEWAQKNPQAFTAIAAAIGAVAASIVAVNIAMALNPFTLIAAGIAAVVVGAIYLANKFQVVRDAFETMINGIITGINVVIRGLNLLPKVNIPTIGKVDFGKIGGGGLSGADISRYQNIPAMANGGIVTSPTLALIGEAGPEAVVPLDRAGAMGNNVTINVNGGDPQQVVNALRRYMQLNGSVPIRTAF